MYLRGPNVEESGARVAYLDRGVIIAQKKEFWQLATRNCSTRRIAYFSQANEPNLRDFIINFPETFRFSRGYGN